jgi:type II secretory ATPase GspE/PulE/Tfp pilus assembly ATPase PilB-like protein
LHTGYAGRTSLSELLVVDDVLREAVLRKLPTRDLQDVAVRQGMRTLLQTGLGRVLSGQTTVDEVLRVVAADF